MRRLRALSALMVGTLLGSLLVIVGGGTAQATTPSCAAGVLTPLHRPLTAPNTTGPFYVDMGRGLDSNWIGYRLDPTSLGLKGTPYIKLSLVKDSGNLQIAAKGYDTMEVTAETQDPTLEDQTLAYFYLTADNAFTTPVSFTATLWDGDPASPTSVAVCTFTDGFSKAEDIIAANPNSISSITVTSDEGVSIVTAVGQTGTMGNPSKDYIGTNGTYYVTSGGSSTIGNTQKSAFQSAISMDPNWDATNYVLQGMELYKTSPGTTKYYDSVRFYLSKAEIEGGYTIVYRVKPVHPTGSATLKPRQVIASGNEYKYTAGFPATISALSAPGADVVEISKSLKSVSAGEDPAKCGLVSGPCWRAVYEVAVTNPGDTELTGIEMVDTPTARDGVTWTYGEDAKKDEVLLIEADLPAVTSTSITFQPFDLAAKDDEGDSTTFEYSLYITGSVTNVVKATIGAGTDRFESNAVTALMDITTESLPPTSAGTNNYSTVIEQQGGTSCTWSATGLPAWLAIDPATGELKTTAGAVAGTYTFTVTSSCSGELSASREYTLNVLGISTSALPNVCLGDGYLQNLLAVGGSSYSWSLSAGSLPGNISLTAAGSIRGEAQESGTASFTVMVTSGSVSATRALTLTVTDCTRDQVITFPQVPARTWGSPNPSSTPTASSGLMVTVINNTPDVCSYSGGVITILRIGTCSLTAAQAGQAYAWLPAAPVTMSFVINPAPVTVTAASQTKVQGTADPTCSTSVSGLVQGDTVTGVTCSRVPGESPGSYVITPTGGNFSSNYAVAYVNGTLTITAPAATAPGAPGAGRYTPVSMTSTTITWGPSATAGVTYEAYYNDVLVCSTTETRCEADRIIGPKSRVTVLAVRNGLKSDRVRIIYRFDQPILALTVYFDVDRSNITASERKKVVRVTTILKREGFLKYAIVGHTDSDASAAYNKALSERRSASLRALARQLIGGGSYEAKGSGFGDPAAPNTTPKGKSLNRRSVLYING